MESAKIMSPPRSYRCLLLLLLTQISLQASGSSAALPDTLRQLAKSNHAQDKKTHDLTLFLLMPDPSAEVNAAVKSLGLPIRRQEGREGTFVAVVGTGETGDLKLLNGLKPTRSNEGYRVVHGPLGELWLASRTQHGLANGLYDVRRALLVAPDKIPSPARLLPEGDHSPHFAQRIFYHFVTTWNLQHLTVDTFTAEQWRVHLQRMRALNANQFYFDIWADQYYHPDYPETHANKVQYDRLREACDYAHKIGLRTGVVIFPCQVPPSVYQAHPRARAVEAANYHGINMCPSRAWDRVVSFDTFLLRYFGSSVDDVIVEMQDPGSCLCGQCCKQFPELVNRFIQTYRHVPGGPADRKINLCTLHFRDWLEEPHGVAASRIAFPIKDLRKRVFAALPKGTTLSDIDNQTMDLGRRQGLKSCYFFFDLDPESGLESAQVFPRVKLRRIESQIQESVKRGHDGILDYRMMPFAQHVADYALFRKCWDPSIDLDVAMTELAAEWKIPADKRPMFVKAMRDLDDWWEKRDIKSLDAADVALQLLWEDEDRSEYLTDLKDLVVVLRVLAHYWQENREKVTRPDFFPPPELVHQVHRLMINCRIFEAYTVYQHWELRSKEMIGQRLRWWLGGLQPVNPQTAPPGL